MAAQLSVDVGRGGEAGIIAEATESFRITAAAGTADGMAALPLAQEMPIQTEIALQIGKTSRRARAR